MLARFQMGGFGCRTHGAPFGVFVLWAAVMPATAQGWQVRKEDFVAFRFRCHFLGPSAILPRGPLRASCMAFSCSTAALRASFTIQGTAGRDGVDPRRKVGGVPTSVVCIDAVPAGTS